MLALVRRAGLRRMVESSRRTIRELILDFKREALARGWELGNPSRVRGLCGTASGVFATMAAREGYRVRAARLAWHYLGSEVVVHYAAEVDGTIYDWTAAQFLWSAPLPALYGTVKEWAQAIGEGLPKYYKGPTSTVEPFACG